MCSNCFMEGLVENLKIVVMESPIDCISDVRAQELFSKLVELKIKGFAKEYPYGVLPLCVSDFFADHFAICEEHDGDLIPIAAYRSVSHQKCKTFHSTFPILDILNELGEPAKLHKNFIENVVKDATGRIDYDSSFTVVSEYRKNPLIFDLINTIQYFFHKEKNSSGVFVGGVDRFKMNRYYNFMGYDELRVNGERLPSLPVNHLNGEIVTFYYVEQFSTQLAELAEKYKSVWDARLVIGGEHEMKERKAA